VNRDVQELVSTPLQASHEVEHDGEDTHDRECDRDIDEGVSQRFNERMVESGLFMASDNCTLVEQGWDLSHGGQSREEQSAVG